MATLSHADYSAEVHFAQRLAANEKKIRDRAMKRLRKWINVRSQSNTNEFEKPDLLKIWKGLFYCMWMCDKALVQEELADTISQLIHVFQSPNSALLFVDTFFETMAREWGGIDRLRLDKFYLLIRKCLVHSFKLLQKNDWNIELIDQLMEVLKTGVFSADKEIPDGLRYHLIEIYLGELTNVGGNQLTEKETLKILEPFCQLAAKTSKSAILNTIVNEIFKKGIIVASDVGREQVENEENEEDGNSKRKEKIKLKFEYVAIADYLFSLASAADVSNQNRKRLYDIVRRLRDLSEGRYPVEAGDLKLHNAIENMHKMFKQEKKERRKRWRESVKKRKRKTSDTVNDDAEQPAMKKVMNKDNKTEDITNKDDDDLKPIMKEKSRIKSKSENKSKKAKKIEITVENSAEKETEMNEDVKLTHKTQTGKSKTDKSKTGKSQAAKSKSTKSQREDVKTNDTNGTMETSLESPPFAKFEKAVVPTAFVRKGLKKSSASKQESDSSPSPQKKRVEFALAKNKMQHPNDYKAQLRSSPLIPFDKTKKPTHSVLKQSPRSTVSPRDKRSTVSPRDKRLRRSTRIKSKKKQS